MQEEEEEESHAEVEDADASEEDWPEDKDKPETVEEEEEDQSLKEKNSDVLVNQEHISWEEAEIEDLEVGKNGIEDITLDATEKLENVREKYASEPEDTIANGQEEEDVELEFVNTLSNAESIDSWPEKLDL